jgi:hypothetical protein
MDIRDGLLMRKNEKPVSVSKGTVAEGHLDAFKHGDSAVIAGKSVCQHVDNVAVEDRTYTFKIEDSAVIAGKSVGQHVMALLSKATHVRVQA